MTDKIEFIISNLNTEFLKNLFSATLLQLENKNNPIMYNSFAFSFREFTRHIFYGLAPDEDVKNCSWFVQNKDTNITRAQRIFYSIQGGLEDNFVKEELGINSKQLKEDIIKEVNRLSKYTHIEEEVFEVPEKEGEKIVESSLTILYDFFKHINSLRIQLISKLEETIFKIIDEVFLIDTFNEIDSLSTHHFIEEVSLQEVKIENITSENIYILINGSVYITQQYGSDRDVKRGDGIITGKSFDFKVSKAISVKSPLSVSILSNEIDIDYDNFYE